MCFSDEYCQLLEKLVRLAPPISSVTEVQQSTYTQTLSINGLQGTTLFQSILVTQYHHDHHGHHHHDDDPTISQNKEEEGKEEKDDDNNNDNLPWPVMEYDSYCKLPIVQEHVLLEIASGLNRKGEMIPKRQLLLPKKKEEKEKEKEDPNNNNNKNNMNVILPGSLRENGDYCLVDVAFVQVDPGVYQWKVQETQFYNLPNF